MTTTTPRELYVHDLSLDLRTLVERREIECSRETPSPSEGAKRELEHARAALKNREQVLGLRFDRVMAGEEKL